MNIQLTEERKIQIDAQTEKIWQEIIDKCLELTKEETHPLFDLLVGLKIAQDISCALLNSFEKNANKFDKERVDLEVLEILHQIKALGEKSIPIIGCKYQETLENKEENKNEQKH